MLQSTLPFLKIQYKNQYSYCDIADHFPIIFATKIK